MDRTKTSLIMLRLMARTRPLSTLNQRSPSIVVMKSKTDRRIVHKRNSKQIKERFGKVALITALMMLKHIHILIVLRPKTMLRSSSSIVNLFKQVHRILDLIQRATLMIGDLVSLQSLHTRSGERLYLG